MTEWGCSNVLVSVDLNDCFAMRDLCLKTKGGLDTVIYKKYIFDLCPHSWCRVRKTLGIS